MARLPRGRMRHVARRRFKTMLGAALIAYLCEDFEGSMVLFAACIRRWMRYRDMAKPTLVQGICPHRSIFDVLGGCDFREVLRFEKHDFRILLQSLLLPHELEIRRGGYGATRVPMDVTLALTLWRLSSPTTLVRDRLFWGMSEMLICEVFNLCIEAIYERWVHLMRSLQVEAIIPKVETFAAAIHSKGAPLETCWGFIDGTIRAISRPKEFQRLYYNGHKRKHALKYQAVDSPDGIIRMLWGPMLGRRHDVAVMGENGLAEVLEQCFTDEEGQQCCIYGDPAYSSSPWLQTPYKGVLTPPQRAFNKRMSKVRVSVERGFGKIVSLWSYVDYVKKQQVGLRASGLGKVFTVCGILTYCHSTLYQNDTARYFGVKAPSIREYLQGQG